MVNKCETIYFIISISDKRLSSVLISLILPLFFYLYLLFPYLFHLNFVVSEGNVHILFCRYIWAELFLLFWTFLSGTFFSGGGSMCTQCTPLPKRLWKWFILTHMLCCVEYCASLAMLIGI